MKPNHMTIFENASQLFFCHDLIVNLKSKVKM